VTGDGQIRTLIAVDVPQAMELKEEAGWNQTAADWERLLRLAPDGCFCLEVDGVLAATTTAFCYGRDLAWIGMVLTRVQYRGRGYARRLMEHALAFLRARDVAWAKLDATDMGRPLYAALGFMDECAIERWGRDASQPPRFSSSLGCFIPAELDRSAFGTDRRRLLFDFWRERAIGNRDGYAMLRPGSRAVYFGPCVAADAGRAEVLQSWAIADAGGQPLYWDLFPANADAVRLAREHGFSPRRRLVRMGLRLRDSAEPIPWDVGRYYAIAGFEYG
jgi:GNAT superfamily N-acetyltransferase